MDREMWKKFGQLSSEQRKKIVDYIKESNSNKLKNSQIIEEILNYGESKWEEILSS